MKRITNKKAKEFEVIKVTKDLLKKPIKILLTPAIVKTLGIPLVKENGLWWLEVNKKKEKKE